MKSNIKKILALSACMAFLNVSAQVDATLQYVKDDTQISTWGTARQETYDIAIPLTDPGLVGSEIRSISVPLGVAEGLIDCKIWIASKLQLQVIDNAKVNVADLFTVDLPCPVADDSGLGTLMYAFAAPFVIPEGGCYVGYSVTASRVDGAVLATAPIALGESNTDERFWIHGTRSYVNWLEAPTQINGYSMLSVNLNGDFHQNSASVSNVASSFAAVNKPGATSARITNMGWEEISSIDYTVETNGNTESYHLDVVPTIPKQFMSSGVVSINIPSNGELGTFPAYVTIDKVNGETNLGKGSTAESEVTVLAYIPKHKALMEEYTGMWCGWCTRGWAALEAMKSLHPEDFICVAYHQNDPIQMNTYPDFVTNAFPSSYLDRIIQCDPYFGVSQWVDPFSIESDWQQRCNVVSPVSIEAEAYFNEDNMEVVVSTSLDWVALPPSGDYRFGYILTEDNMHSPDWTQQNNYVGYPQNLEYIQPFIDGEYAQSVIRDLPFNDVAVMNSDFMGVENSIKDISVDTPNTHEYTFNLYNARNMNWEPIIQDTKELNVVVFVLKFNDKFGEVINAEKVKVKSTSGLTTATEDAAVVSTVYYNLVGNEVQPSEAGVYIKVTTYSDGRQLSKKVKL